MQWGMMEWCNDWYNGDYSVQSVTDPQGAREPDDEKCRIVRGGCQYSERYNKRDWVWVIDKSLSRSAKRFYNRPTYRKVYYVTPGGYSEGYWLHGSQSYPNGRKMVDFDIGFRLCCDKLEEK